MLEFFKINDVYQLVDVKTEEFLKQHEAMHETMDWRRRLFDHLYSMGY